MIDPAHVPPLLAQAQVSEIVATSEGLSKGGVYFICAVLASIVFALYRELATERTKYNALLESKIVLIEKHNAEMLAVVKENMPLAYKLAEGVQEVGRLAVVLTKE